MNLRENIERIQEIMGLKTEDERGDNCLNRFEPLIKQAVDWWKNWLNHPTTEKKWNSLYGGEKNYKDILPTWLTILNKIQLIPYHNTDTQVTGSNGQKITLDEKNKNSAFAFATKQCPTNVFVNCELHSENDLTILIHELQHVLENQHPINDLVKIAQKYKDAPLQTSSDSITTEEQLVEKIGKENAEDLRRNFPNDFIKIYNIATKLLANEQDKEYVCNPKEKLSNLAAVRELLNITPDKQITLPQLMPYLTGKKYNEDVEWLFLCWVQLKFPPLQSYLDDLNSLAVNNTQGNTNV